MSKTYRIIENSIGLLDENSIGNGKKIVYLHENELTERHHNLFLGELIKIYQDAPERTKKLFRRWMSGEQIREDLS